MKLFPSSPEKRKVLLLILLNLSVLALIVFLLFRTDIQNLFTDETQKTPEAVFTSQLIFEEEALSKQWDVLDAKTKALEMENQKLEEAKQILLQKTEELNALIEENKNLKSELEKQKAVDPETNLRSLASKMAQMPPQNAAALLKELDPMLATEILRMMDKMAEEAGQNTITGYILSLLDPAVASKITALLAVFPEDKDAQELNNLAQEELNALDNNGADPILPDENNLNGETPSSSVD